MIVHSSITNESIVPFFDLINHSDEPSLVAGFNHDKKGIELKSTRKIEQGKELTIDYAEFEPKCWLFNYGFAN